MMPTMTKPRGRIKLMPTVAAGTPMPPANTGSIPEPVVGVGMNTGKAHFVAGEAGPEDINFQPRGKIATMMPTSMNGVRTFANGGGVTVGDPNVYDPTSKIWRDTRNGNFMVHPDDGGDGIWYNQQGQPVSGPNSIIPPPAATTPATNDPLVRQTQAREATQGANQAVINASQGVNAANLGVVNAKRGTIAPTQGVIDASGRVIDTQLAQNDQNRSFLNQQSAANAQTLAEQRSIKAAEANIPDLTATAQAQAAYDDQKYKYALGGITPDQEVNLPNGTNQQLAPGVRGKIMSQADLVTKQAKDAQAERAIQLDNARIAVALKGTDVAAAQAAAAKAGLTLDQAQLLVSKAQIEADQAGITLDQYQNQLSQAKLNEDIAANKPAGQVLYTDPYTGASEYVTQAEKDKRDFYYQNSAPGGKYVYDPNTKSYAPAELAPLSDSGVIQFGIGDDSAFGPFQNPYQGMPAPQRRQMAIDELQRRGYSTALASYLIDSAIDNANKQNQEAGGIAE